MSKPKLRDAAQREMIRERLDTNLLVEAGAGSGKTESLAGRMVETVARGICSVEEIAAVTFTRKAAGELRGRFRGELERCAEKEIDPLRRDRIVKALRGMERMFAGTIHSFCAHLLRERPVEAGLAPGFREIEEPEDAILRRRFWREYVEQAESARSPEFLALLTTEVKPADLDGSFRAVCAHPDVEFPPGSGSVPDLKQPWTDLIRFWDDLQKLCPPIPEDSTCAVQALMPKFATRIRNADRNRPAVLAKLLAPWAGKKSLVQKHWGGQGKNAIARIDDFRAQTVDPFLRAWREYVYRIAVTLLVDARKWANAQRRRAALLNFADLLFYAAKLVRENHTVRDALQRKYRNIFVDEFQDTDPMQAELLFLLAAEEGVGEDWTAAPLRPGALFLVGDPKQSIYRFRRADIEVYQLARRRIEQTGGTIVPLTTCFRSGSAICTWANEVFPNLFPKEHTEQQPGFERLDPGADDPESAEGPVRLAHDASTKGSAEVLAADAAAIAAYIRQEVDAGKRTWGDFLLLTRKKKGRLGAYAQALEAATVPYEVSGSGGLLESEYVQALVSLLFALTHSDDGIALTGVLRGPCFGLSDPQLYEYCKSGGTILLSAPVADEVGDPVATAIRTMKEWRPLVRRLPAGAAIELILEQSGLLAKAAASSAGGGEAGKLVYALDCLRAACETGLTLADAVVALEEVGEDDDSDAPVLEPGRRDVVRVMNLHKAKGLEGKVVFLADPLGGVKLRTDLHIRREAGNAHGFLKIVKEKGEWNKETLALPAGWDALEATELVFQAAEEIRLVYVAATRARETLIVSQFAGKTGNSTLPWTVLDPFLAARPTVKIRARREPRAVAPPDLSENSRIAAQAVRERTRAAIEVPCFETLAVSTLASHAALHSGDVVEGPAGADWGSLIHELLQHAAGHLAATRQELEAVALWHAAGDSILAGCIPEALNTVEKVRASEFWQQVAAAEERLAEVPVGAPWDEQTPPRVLAKGIIDLVLRTPEGWHIIDYKTDTVSVDQLVRDYREQLRAYARIWEKITGKRVAFAGIYSVRALRLSGDVRGEAFTA